MLCNSNGTANNRQCIQYAAGFSSEAEVEKFFTQQKSLSAFGAIVFDVKSFVGHRIRSNSTVTYKIRLPSEKASGSVTHWQTSEMFYWSLTEGDMYGGETPGRNKLHQLKYAYI